MCEPTLNLIFGQPVFRGNSLFSPSIFFLFVRTVFFSTGISSTRWRPWATRTWWCPVCRCLTGLDTRARSPACPSPCWPTCGPSSSTTGRRSSCACVSDCTLVCTFHVLGGRLSLICCPMVWEHVLEQDPLDLRPKYSPRHLYKRRARVLRQRSAGARVLTHWTRLPAER